MELTIAELGSLGEFVSSIGVVVTLIHLAIQIRQTKKGLQDNTAALLGASEVSGNEKAVDLTKSIYQDGDGVIETEGWNNSDAALNRFRDGRKSVL